jgi:pimeloyl-ACP methyl ester carboxylesterase
MPATLCTVDPDGAALPGVLDRPAGPARGAVVALHGAEAGERSYFLYAHLAALLPPAGVAVLRYDRRPAADGGDVPFALQAADARAAMASVRREIGPVPVGLWGYSQGGWAAIEAADADPAVAFLVLVSAAGVSPARQMRYGTAEQLRRHGYGAPALAELAVLRATVEDYLRGRLPRTTAQAEVDRLADRPWFPLAHVRRRLPEPGAWPDLDHDPTPAFGRLRRPALIFYGDGDEWTPVDDSVAAWRRVTAPPGPRVVRLAGCGHLPTPGGVEDVAAISPAYAAELLGWLDRLLP